MIYAFDLETLLIRPGQQTPPIVCYSWANNSGSGIGHPDEAADFLVKRFAVGDHVVGANIAFDLSTICDQYPQLIGAVFDAYDRGIIHDVQLRQALDAIAGGHLYLMPDRSPLRDPESGKRKTRYSLAICAQLTLGRILSKTDTWRMRYGDLQGIPIADWPIEARQYSIDDAVTTLDVFNAQAGFRNLHNESAQCRAAFALRLMGVWGVKTDPVYVDAFNKRVSEQYEKDQARFIDLNILRKDGSCDTGYLKSLVTTAYDSSPPMTEPSARFPQGQVKTDADTLSESGDTDLEAYAGTSKTRKLNNTYIPVLQAGVVYGISSMWNPLVESGRTSSAYPNLQNIAK